MLKKIGVVFFLGMVLLVCGCYVLPNEQPSEVLPEEDVEISDIDNVQPQTKDFDYSVFSWSSDVFEKDNIDEVISTLKQHNIGSIYQWFSSDVQDQSIIDFITAMNDQDIKVYVLTGDPSWAKEKNVQKIYDVIDRANSLGGVSGVVLDIEPSGLDEYDDNKDELMVEFASNINLSYDYAKNLGFEVVVCVSANWDELPELRDIIENSCDSVCVMNYFVDREFEKILREAEYAKLYGKHLISASELQPPGEHGVTEKNTYYGQDVSTVIEVFEKLSQDLEQELELNDISFSFHHYESLAEANP